jgi:predicted flap endonuclease-1-like 5' DNA nuclease
MKVLRVFFIGLVYGWFLHWLVNKIFVEDNLRRLNNENEILRQRLITLETPRTQRAQPARRQPEPPPLPVEEVEPVAVTGTGPVPPHRDDLKLIKGVGPQIEKKLNTAGVYTFDQMSRLTTEQLQAILGGTKRNPQNSDNLINQAKKFAEDGPKG